MIIILRTTVDIMIQATILFPNYRVSRALRFSSACPCPRSPFLSFPRVLSFHHTLFLLSSRALSFFRNFAKASARASPRKASSRAIPVITTTSIFVKSLSPLSSSPSPPPPLPLPSPPFSPRRLPRFGPSICRFINPVVLYRTKIGSHQRHRRYRAIFSKL